MTPDAPAATELARSADGRRLAYCVWGAAEGAPIFYLHGLPGSRYLRHVGDAYELARLRVVTYDRPGYGRSDRSAGRTVFDTAADVAAIADRLGLDRFAVAGVSAGGVHALAVAAALPDRVTRCVTVKALAPQAPGLDFYEGMDPADAATIRRLVELGHDAIRADAEETRSWVESGCPGIDPPPPVGDMLRDAFREAYRQGLDGHVDDWTAHLSDHGYDVGAVTTPTWMLAARDDEQVPPAHARWLAARLRNGRLTWLDGGHLDSHEEAEVEAFAWAAHGTEGTLRSS